MYRFYEKADKAGIRNICIHKGLMPADYEQSWPGVWQYQTAWDLPKVAKDWPQLNFIIYHGCFRAFMDAPGAALAEFEKTGDIKWVTELSRVSDKSGTQNVYAEMGTSFAATCVIDPRFAAAMLHPRESVIPGGALRPRVARHPRVTSARSTCSVSRGVSPTRRAMSSIDRMPSTRVSAWAAW